MVLLFISGFHRPQGWRRLLAEELPDLDFRVWADETGDPADIDFALVWDPPMGELARYPNLKAIFSLAAGSDHLLKDPALPEVPLIRMVDPALISGMNEFVIHHVLHFHRRFDVFEERQRRREWKELPAADTACRRVGVMGLGAIGSAVAGKLGGLGFAVAGWSRSAKEIGDVESFDGEDALIPFLNRTEILICLLPLTPATEGIINKETLAALPEGAYVINCARGGHLVEDDLLAALDSGRLAGAALDVFRAEPLPREHPFWRHPKVVVTPHIASLTVPRTAIPHIVENIRRIENGQPPTNQVSRERGY